MKDIFGSASSFTLGKCDEVMMDEDRKGLADSRLIGGHQLRKGPTVPLVKLVADAGHNFSIDFAEKKGGQLAQLRRHRKGWNRNCILTQ